MSVSGGTSRHPSPLLSDVSSSSRAGTVYPGYPVPVSGRRGRLGREGEPRRVCRGVSDPSRPKLVRPETGATTDDRGNRDLSEVVEEGPDQVRRHQMGRVGTLPSPSRSGGGTSPFGTTPTRKGSRVDGVSSGSSRVRVAGCGSGRHRIRPSSTSTTDPPTPTV